MKMERMVWYVVVGDHDTVEGKVDWGEMVIVLERIRNNCCLYIV